jgi:hypothetical protein
LRWAIGEAHRRHTPRIDFPDALYRAYTHACLLEDDRPIREALQASRYAIGDEAFVEATVRKLARLRRGRLQDADIALPQVIYTLEQVDAAVAAEFGLRPEALKAHGHTSGVAKVLAVELACRWTGLTHRTIGAHYGGMTSAAVSNIRRKIREGKPTIAKLVEKVSGQLDSRQS